MMHPTDASNPKTHTFESEASTCRSFEGRVLYVYKV